MASYPSGNPFFTEPGELFQHIGKEDVELFRLIGKEDISGAEKPAAEFGPKVKGPAQCINDRTGQVHVQLVRDDERDRVQSSINRRRRRSGVRQVWNVSAFRVGIRVFDDCAGAVVGLIRGRC